MGLIDAIIQESIIAAAPVKKSKLGCDTCPRNIPGIVKILSPIYGKKVLILPQSPGPKENDQGMELVGKAGTWWWNELKTHAGIVREDCDIRNTVACFPADRDKYSGEWVMRDPTKEEIKHCSVHLQDALEKGKHAKIWIILGKVAAQTILKKKNPDSSFWNRDNIHVFVLDHPSYFTRGTAPKERLVRFRNLLKDIGDEFNKVGDRWDILRQQDYKGITMGRQALDAAREILELSKKWGRVSYDVEYDIIDGKKVLLCVGASPKPGMARVFITDHPENTAPEKEKGVVREVIRRLVRHKHAKVMHHGSEDDRTFKELLGVEAENYDYDTNYGEYMVDSSQKEGYGLKAIVKRRLPKFAQYEELVIEAVPKGMTVEEGKEIGEFHLARVPLWKLILYNGCDNDMTKRIELGSKDKVPIPLVRVYKDAVYVIEEMQGFGPWLDMQHTDRMADIYPHKKEYHANKIRLLADNPDLNVNSTPQMLEVIYGKWGVPWLGNPEESSNTKAETLDLIMVKHPHPGVKNLQDYRECKNRVERIEAFKRSAFAHLGRVITYWWATGARTGRISSGGGNRPDKRNLGNLQNIPKNDHIKNMLVSWLKWRDFVEEAKKGIEVRKNSEGKDVYVLPNLRDACLKYRDMDFFISADYSQMELRILAQVTGDPELIKIFNSGEDIHAAIGALWTGWTFEEIMDDEEKRTMVKGYHFGTIYGQTALGLFRGLEAQGVKTTKKKVAELQEKYFSRMEYVAGYLKETPKFAEEHGYVENLFGFKTPIDVKKERGKGSWWANQAINAGIQGSAHQVLMMGFALLKRRREEYPLIKPQMEIHDNLVTISKLMYLEKTSASVRQLMEKDAPQLAHDDFGIEWKIPFVAEVKIGFRFGGLIKVKGTMIEAIEKAVLMVDDQEKDLRKLEKEYGSLQTEFVS